MLRVVWLWSSNIINLKGSILNQKWSHNVFLKTLLQWSLLKLLSTIRKRFGKYYKTNLIWKQNTYLKIFLTKLIFNSKQQGLMKEERLLCLESNTVTRTFTSANKKSISKWKTFPAFFWTTSKEETNWPFPSAILETR